MFITLTCRKSGRAQVARIDTITSLSVLASDPERAVVAFNDESTLVTKESVATLTAKLSNFITLPMYHVPYTTIAKDSIEQVRPCGEPSSCDVIAKSGVAMRVAMPYDTLCELLGAKHVY